MAAHMSQYEQLAAVLTNASASMDDMLPMLIDLREHLDVVHTPEYPVFLKAMIPAFVSVLTTRTAPTFENNVSHK